MLKKFLCRPDEKRFGGFEGKAEMRLPADDGAVRCQASNSQAT